MTDHLSLSADERRALREMAERADQGPYTVEPSCAGASYGWDVPEIDDADYRDSRFGNEATARYVAAACNAASGLTRDVDRLEEEVDHWKVKAKAYGQMATDANTTLGGIARNERLRDAAVRVMAEVERLRAELAELRAAHRGCADCGYTGGYHAQSCPHRPR